MAELLETSDKFQVSSKGVMGLKYFTLFCLSANLCLSVSIVLLNKIVYTNIGFPNVTLTLIHFILTSIGLVVCERANIFEVKHIPILKILPLALSFCGFVVFTNLSLGYNSVGTYQIIKTLTMPIIMFIQQVFYNRTFSLKIKLTLVPVTTGVILNSAYDVNFNVPGTVFACLGVVVTSVYQVWVGEKQKELQVNSMQLLYYQAPLSALILLVFLPAIEPPWVVGAVLDHTWTVSDMVLILASGLNAFLINLSIYWIIGNTSAVTYNIVGQLKFCLTLLGGYMLFREPVLPIQFLGILVTFLGVYLYAHVKSPVRSGSTILANVEEPDQAFPVETSEQALHAESTEGFLCPSCYLAYPTAEVLQNHYETSHSQDIAGPSLDSRGLLICPCCKMKLGSEVELQSHYKRHHSAEQQEGEIAALKIKVKALEEEKTLVLEELLGLRLQLPDIFKENSSIKEEKNVLEQKAASLAGELADLKANFDEVSTKKNSLESYLNEVQEKITGLEMEIQRRPEADDVNLLQQELISVQKMMDQLALQREAEKETLQTQCVDLQQKCLRLEKEKSRVEDALLAAPKTQELESLQAKISDLTSNISMLHQTIDVKNEEHSKLLLQLEKCADNDELKQQLLDKNALLEETLRVVEMRDERMNELNSELKEVKGTIERMKMERAEFFSKIEEGEGANTAILQLKEENSRLQEQVVKQQVMAAQVSHDFEVKITSLHTELKKIKAQHQTSDAECCELKNKLSDTVKNLSAANTKVQHLETELKIQCQNLSTLEASKNAKLLSLEGMLQNTKKDLEEKSRSLESMKQLINKKEKEYSLNLKILEDMKCELEKQVLQYQSQLEKMTLQESEMQNKLKQLKDSESILKSEMSQKDSKIEEIEMKLAEILEMYKQSEQKEGSLRNELQELQETHQHVSLKVEDFQKQVADYEAVKLELSKKLHHKTEELQKSQDNESQLVSSLDNMNEVKSQLSAKVLELDNEVKVMTESINELKSEKNATFADFQEASKLLDEKKEKCKILEQKVEELQENLQNEKDVRIRNMQEVQKLQEAKELLIGQKVALHKEMDAVKEEKAKEITSLQKTIEGLQSGLKNAEEMNRSVNADLEAALQASKLSKEKWETRQASYEAQIGVLDANLLTLKEDLRSEHLRRETAEQKVDELSGNKLELEAKLENALDERRALLDRCLKSETECEKLQKITTDLRRKLEDSVAALQELGRENQTLQMENVKHMTRKWTDDSEVTHCTACGKQFTVTVRKHHCRNCGNIFCNECSLKTATVASSRKPVRVCDICYSEVSK